MPDSLGTEQKKSVCHDALLGSTVSWQVADGVEEGKVDSGCPLKILACDAFWGIHQYRGITPTIRHLRHKGLLFGSLNNTT